MNTAHWRIYNADYTRGSTIGPTHSIPPWIWVFLATIFICGMVMAGKYVAKCRKSWKKNKNKGEDLIEEQ